MKSKSAAKAKTPTKIHTDPWKKYGALARAKVKTPAVTPPTIKKPPVAPGAMGAGTGSPPSPPPAATLETDAQAAIAENTRANPPRQWDQPGGPSDAVSPLGESSGEPPSRVDRADRKFSSGELKRIAKDARAAIAQGAPRAKVEQRLRENGLDPAGVLNG